jgi:4,5-dihydroxyphthalate decarboxylase
VNQLPLTLSCLDYDRVRPLETGEVQAAGIDLNFLRNPPDESIWRMAEHGEFDAAEMTLATYLRLHTEGADLIALPVFLVRCFPHSGIFVHSGSGIREPRDLEGRRVAVGEYRMSIAVWARGILSDDYGLDLGTIEWCTARPEPDLDPRELRVTLLPEGPPLAERLEAGDFDALIAPRVPPAFRAANPAVARIFPDPRGVEEEYFRRTGIFPILHLVVLRRSLFTQHPWVASSLYRAFVAAKEVCYGELEQTMEGLRVTAPWFEYHLDDVRRLMSADYWAYGLEPNRHALETFCRYAHEQHVISRPVALDELFAPNADDRPVASTRSLIGA